METEMDTPLEGDDEAEGGREAAAATTAASTFLARDPLSITLGAPPLLALPPPLAAPCPAAAAAEEEEEEGGEARISMSIKGSPAPVVRPRLGNAALRALRTASFAAQRPAKEDGGEGALRQ